MYTGARLCRALNTYLAYFFYEYPFTPYKAVALDGPIHCN